MLHSSYASIISPCGNAREADSQTLHTFRRAGNGIGHTETANAKTFMIDFANAIRRADRLQPALLIASIVTALGFGIGATATGRTLHSWGRPAL